MILKLISFHHCQIHQMIVLIFLNKSISYDLKDIKGVCITKVPLKNIILKIIL